MTSFVPASIFAIIAYALLQFIGYLEVNNEDFPLFLSRVLLLLAFMSLYGLSPYFIFEDSYDSPIVSIMLFLMFLAIAIFVGFEFGEHVYTSFQFDNTFLNVLIENVKPISGGYMAIVAVIGAARIYGDV